MIQLKRNSEPYNVALITVCVNEETLEQILSAIRKMPWAVSLSHWDNYLASNRRPQISANVVNAEFCIALIDFDEDSGCAVETADYLNQKFAGRIAIVALSSESDPDMLLRALRSGCNEFLGKPFQADQFLASLKNLETKWSSAASKIRNRGQVLSFFGAKGGVGTTTISIHLAISLVRLHAKKVLLIDNHPRFGHVCLYLGLEGANYYFYELVRNVDRLDEELLRGFVAKHSAGMDVLASPDTIGSVRPIDTESLVRTIEFLRGEYDYILLDCPAPFDDTSLSIVDASDRAYLVATPDVAAVRNLSRYAEILMRSAQRAAKTHIVINRYSSEGAVDVKQIENAIRLPVDVKLPNSYSELVRAMNVGEPLSNKKKSEISSQFTRWADEITGTSSQPVRSNPLRVALW